ncbi:MAG: S8 family serine peptidase [Bacteroidales bacterium]|nr:S8 family serine peptidase [Bacteroidales bacterium]MBR7168241.1 S8 family serine peptidase [Bacteroidales bacterium]
MRKFYFIPLVLSLLLAIPAVGQDRNNDDEVVKLDQHTRYNCKPNEVLVKFNDYSDIKLAGKGAKTFTSATKKANGVNAVLKEYGVSSIEQLLPNFVMPKAPRKAKSYGGQDVVEKDLSQLHLIVLDKESPKNHYELIEELKQLPEVEYAEPNYICYALGTPSEGEMLSDALKADHKSTANNLNAKSQFATNDPLYSTQWGFDAVGLNQLLQQPKLDSTAARKIIAIIDTGVDVDHADLADNIWTNTAEANGAANQDDDGNGLKDDVHGYDFVNQTGDMHDFNSHGTHCAGIAAAVGGNGIGIIGANPDALIMPVAVMQSDGTGDAATIIRGINYAAQNGADIISMSIGTYAHSIAMEQALAQAYQTAVLVAAAGNDSRAIDPRCCTGCNPTPAPMYPGAFTFVFGVQATYDGGGLASFSNYDCDGPSYSQYNEEQLYNYELSAPGAGIMSTVPGGQYRSYNGTSMACPLVAGGIAALLDRRDYVSTELLFGDLINYSTEFMPVNFMTIYSADSVSPAIFQAVTIEVNDTMYGDGGMYADAGEHIQIYPTIRTMWGAADSIVYWIEYQEFEDTNTLQILQDRQMLGRPLSSYAKAKALNPIDILVDSNIVDGRKICLTLCATAPNATDTLKHDFTLKVTNGVKLFGLINQNDTLWPNVQYIVTSNLRVADGDTLFIMPGTTLKIGDGCIISGCIIANGKPDSMITFTKTDLGQGWSGFGFNSNVNVSYCKISEINYVGGPNCNVPVISRNTSYYNNNIMSFDFRYEISQSYKNTFYNNGYGSILLSGMSYVNFTHNNIIENYNLLSYDDASVSSFEYPTMNLNIFNNSPYNIHVSYQDCLNSNNTYYGSSKEEIIRQGIWDMFYPGATTSYYVDLSNRANRPSAEAHGIVWKVEVNGYDAQDEFDSIAPLGMGTHEFKVYFNRAMDTNVTPMLAMGVRPPYTQTAIGENAYWSADSTIWTAHLTLTGRDAIDGLNRIYVANAQDNEHFEIPFENKRFNVYVSSAGSMSAGFQATAGIGKIDLEWNDQEVNYEDFLGFNLYRFQYDSIFIPAHYDENWNYINDTTIWGVTDTILLNKTLLQDTVYTDFDVVPGERYYYYYKILSTSLTENSPSKLVSCVPHSSIRGDANGSYAVDVADVITTINYVVGNNPQPFLFDAADVNGDGVINVLDVVGTINIILHPENSNAKDSYEQQTAIYTIEDGILYINTPVALGGLQFTLSNTTMNDIEVLSALSGFELVNTTADGNLTLMAYSMSGMQIPEGKHALLRIGEKEISNIVLSDTEGHNVIPLKGGEVGVTDIESVKAQIMKAFPNPFEKEVQLTFVVGSNNISNARLVFTDVIGRQIDQHEMDIHTAGQYSYTWKAKGMQRGMYFATLYVDGQKAHTMKLILK